MPLPSSTATATYRAFRWAQATGKNAFWLAGDWGRDDHGARDGDLGLAEVGLGRNFGPVQVNVSLGQTWGQTWALMKYPG